MLRLPRHQPAAYDPHPDRPQAPDPRVGEAVASDQVYARRAAPRRRKIARDLGVAGRDDGFRLAINHGSNGGESVPHLHVHLLAGRPMEWPPG
ncbi:MAG: HIT domain-containing protein [Verrucomicrobiales bacterium]